MQGNMRILLYFSIIPIVFIFIGAYMIAGTNEGITAAAVSSINKVTKGSADEENKITEDILLKKSTGVATTSVATTTISTIQSGPETTTIIETLSSTSVETTSTTIVIFPSFITFLPVTAVDNYGVDQVSPDDSNYDGTVDLSNDDTRWLTVDGEYVEVRTWDDSVSVDANILNVIATCEIDFVNNKAGNLEFSYNYGAGWSSWLCSQEIASGGDYTCNLYNNGLDDANKVNNAKLRCRMSNNQKGAIGFSIDFIKLDVTTQ